MKRDVNVALSTLEQAQVEVTEAEKQLVGLLSAIEVAPRAEKTAVSRIVEVALQRLRGALLSVETAKTVIVALKDETDTKPDADAADIVPSA